jgi:hypothetical protein
MKNGRKIGIPANTPMLLIPVLRLTRCLIVTGGAHMEPHGYWYATTTCPECNAGQLAFAVRRDGCTYYLLCVECGANYEAPPRPDEHNIAFDPPAEELADPPRWAARGDIEARGWGGSIEGFGAAGGMAG